MNKTLNYYNEFYKAFITNTLDANASNLHHYFLKHLPKGSTILDLGCGSGRDSKAFIEEGYQVYAIDGSQELCNFASEYIGQEVICKTFEQLDYEGNFHGIWACASLLHIPYVDLPKVIQKISKALKPDGYLYASFKYGDFEGERNGRYFTDLTESRLADLIEPLKELSILETMITSDIRADKEDEKWLNIIFKKIPQ
ncbi:methyltransferase domain-containing protein [Alkalibaculum sp. M08DMB]|uniref:Methyltransferase domain-containing protein n=1 Tax=Alkalibaculum sporogenes TaxID=2655001 RepID=A0A6A7KCJ0_9FIRM|nr:class I SAM-dependent methyltransferase [Alkalibaculum sporogenes]MPW27072.1 methyltransferase domain-containing protein [Alkalibaculum sporogenes]